MFAIVKGLERAGRGSRFRATAPQSLALKLHTPSGQHRLFFHGQRNRVQTPTFVVRPKAAALSFPFIRSSLSFSPIANERSLWSTSFPLRTSAPGPDAGPSQSGSGNNESPKQGPKTDDDPELVERRVKSVLWYTALGGAVAIASSFAVHMVYVPSLVHALHSWAGALAIAGAYLGVKMVPNEKLKYASWFAFNCLLGVAASMVPLKLGLTASLAATVLLPTLFFTAAKAGVRLVLREQPALETGIRVASIATGLACVYGFQDLSNCLLPISPLLLPALLTAASSGLFASESYRAMHSCRAINDPLPTGQNKTESLQETPQFAKTTRLGLCLMFLWSSVAYFLHVLGL